MKTKILKSVLPVFAMVLAAGLAFANDANTFSDPDYYNNPLIPGVQVITSGVDCPTSGKNPCLYNGFQVYDDMNLTVEKRFD
ncbi:DUF6520 family protein [uncultured Formosa sp.]|uniref:DUF6520 family protein n=1 Tax=uncultured Formosa sp. TaxID=255435 RepID=UPI0026358C44|nr:DUF6520 family protein [uncultured Formosa sp.]